ncbi:hypothetical protein HMP0721_1526 [Pseudoramibacter alactolyticus ATCC 23263]|uniref:Uncharacterized protein n=1 Tax=Pseudoramibacter alactolyticus ATCC 23263 TaxID=887929 RepID=E6MHP1_9FIRM|nr:hypothetical protein HMP0721_1526 [Pseudoramibacter alactolyticus ATCC 23263]
MGERLCDIKKAPCNRQCGFLASYHITGESAPAGAENILKNELMKIRRDFWREWRTDYEKNCTAAVKK